MIEAVNSGEALEALEANSDVQLPFTDVDMPGTMDGLALARQVHDRWPHIGIIVLSGKSMPQPHVQQAASSTGSSPDTVVRHARELIAA
jgi:CheY-like chemotaxis protein